MLNLLCKIFCSELLTKNVDPHKYSYSGYGVGFDSCSLFLYSGFDWGKNAAIFGVDSSSSVHFGKIKEIVVLVEGPTEGLDGTTVMTEAKYSIKFS